MSPAARAAIALIVLLVALTVATVTWGVVVLVGYFIGIFVATVIVRVRDE